MMQSLELFWTGVVQRRMQPLSTVKHLAVCKDSTQRCCTRGEGPRSAAAFSGVKKLSFMVMTSQFPTLN